MIAVKHRLIDARRRNAVHCRMAGPLLVEVVMQDRRVAVLAPKLLVVR
jgi:hypothetical protein